MRPPLPRQAPPPSPEMTSQSPSSATVTCKRSKTWSKKALKPSFADLPSSLLELIMSHLVLKDNIRASAACKPWRQAAASVRVVEKHPWLLCFPKRGNSFKLLDPLQCKPHPLKLPELAESSVLYSRDGWLLMHRSSSNDIFFFNPFSKELITLPKFELSFLEIAFSCPPTSENCVVLALDFESHALQHRITISTCHPGATEWITDYFPTDSPSYDTCSKLVYLDDRFYLFNCFTGGGTLYSFHQSSRTWHSHLAYIYNLQLWEKKVFLTEKKGELFLMFTSGNEKPSVYKLVSLQWKEMSSCELDGLTFFVSYYNSEMRTNLPRMRDNVYFSRFGYNRKRCVTYSFDEGRYDPCKEWENWLELCPPQSLWIDPPSNVLDICERALNEN